MFVWSDWQKKFFQERRIKEGKNRRSTSDQKNGKRKRFSQQVGPCAVLLCDRRRAKELGLRKTSESGSKKGGRPAQRWGIAIGVRNRGRGKAGDCLFEMGGRRTRRVVE